MAGGTGKFSCQGYFEARCSGSGRFLTGAGEGEKQRKPSNEQSERSKKFSKTLPYINLLLGFPVFFLDSFVHTISYVNPVPGFPAFFLDS